MSQNSCLLIVWLTVTVIGVSGMIAALVWAVRSRQFQNQDRASRLPLESGIPSDQEWDALKAADASPGGGRAGEDEHAPV